MITLSEAIIGGSIVIIFFLVLYGFIFFGVIFTLTETLPNWWRNRKKKSPRAA
ncbi:MAG: hypothetical protein HYW91_02965 [Candidatus Sungbacteria bacterium]|nr:hypothetical protein [Candidatus Sungbacteria bacterium]